MGDTADLVGALQARVRELEDKIEALRISRRVLMNLIDDLEKEKREQLSKLNTHNEQLQKSNYRYARAVMHRDARITQLEAQLRTLSAGHNKTGNTFT